MSNIGRCLRKSGVGMAYMALLLLVFVVHTAAKDTVVSARTDGTTAHADEKPTEDRAGALTAAHSGRTPPAAPGGANGDTKAHADAKGDTEAHSAAKNPDVHSGATDRDRGAPAGAKSPDGDAEDAASRSGATGTMRGHRSPSLAPKSAAAPPGPQGKDEHVRAEDTASHSGTTGRTVHIGANEAAFGFAGGTVVHGGAEDTGIHSGAQEIDARAPTAAPELGTRGTSADAGANLTAVEPPSEYLRPVSSMPMYFTFAVMMFGAVANVGFSSDLKPVVTASGLAGILRVTSFAYWVLMPGTLLVAGFSASSCEDGVPLWAYTIYAVFALFHVSALASACRVLLTSTTCFAYFFALSLIEHFDMASDALFIGTASACERDLLPLWLESWQASFGGSGSSFTSAFAYLGFHGLAALVFVLCAWLPQVLILPVAIAAPACVLYFAFILLIAKLCSLVYTVFWLGWLTLLLWVAALAAPVLFFSYCERGLPSPTDLDFGDPPSLEQYAGLFLPHEGPDGFSSLAGSSESTVSLLTRLILENVLQLFIQSSFFGLSLHVVSKIGAKKQLLSIGISFFVTCAKLIKLLIVVSNMPVSQAVGFFLNVFAILVGMLMLMYVPAKVAGAYSCYPGTWNLSSGCVYAGGA